MGITKGGQVASKYKSWPNPNNAVDEKGKPYYKNSGAVYGKIAHNPNKKGDKANRYVGYTYVNAWNWSKGRGMITCKVRPYEKTLGGVVEGVNRETGEVNEYQKMLATVQFQKTGQKQVLAVLMNVKTKKIKLDDLNMCITPNGEGYTRRGKMVKGFFGSYNR
jgi:hypothetical protein